MVSKYQKNVLLLLPILAYLNRVPINCIYNSFLYIFLMKTTFLILAFLAILTLQQTPGQSSPYTLIPNQIQPEQPNEPIQIQKPASHPPGQLRRNDEGDSEQGHQEKKPDQPTPEVKEKRHNKPPGPGSDKTPPKRNDQREDDSQDLQEPNAKKHHDRGAHQHSERKEEHSHRGHSEESNKSQKEKEEEWAKRREEMRKRREEVHKQREEMSKQEGRPERKQRSRKEEQKDNNTGKEERNGRPQKRRSWENMNPEQMMPARDMPPPPPPPQSRPRPEPVENIQTNDNSTPHQATRLNKC